MRLPVRRKIDSEIDNELRKIKAGLSRINQTLLIRRASESEVWRGISLLLTIEFARRIAAGFFFLSRKYLIYQRIFAAFPVDASLLRAVARSSPSCANVSLSAAA